MNLRTKAERAFVGVDGSKVGLYVAEPEAAGVYPPVLVGFEMFGITGYVKSVADRIAALGYTAIVPDFYHRLGDGIVLEATKEGRERGLEFLKKVTRESVAADAQAALTFAKQKTGSGKAAMFGMSVGGHIAYYAATQVGFDALIVLYPGWITTTDITLSQPEATVTLTPKLAENRTRVLLLSGADDHLFQPADIAEVRKAFDDAKVENEVMMYPGGPHGFFCDERDTFRPEMAADAWKRIAKVLEETIK